MNFDFNVYTKSDKIGIFQSSLNIPDAKLICQFNYDYFYGKEGWYSVDEYSLHLIKAERESNSFFSLFRSLFKRNK